MEERKKKIAILAVCSTLLVALVVVGAVVVFQDGDEKETKEVSTSQKAISTICETTDHPTVCLDSLAGQNTTNPKELIEVAFKAAIGQINEAAKKSAVLRQAQSDPRAKSALDTCGELANRAVNDLQRSYAKFNSFDITGNVNDILLELKIWLSGSITYQETCLDSFKDVPGDAGQKMRDALNVSMQMTSNSLAMVAELSTYLGAMGLQEVQNGSRRRLLSWRDNHVSIIGHVGEFPDWMDFNRRRLLTASPQQIRPNLIVAKDGSGQYRTINEALRNIPKGGNKNNNTTFVLYIKEGVYEEKVVINNTLLMIIGDGANKTRITGKLNFVDGTNTFHTATVAVQGDDFIARDIGFENTAGPEKHQAVALRVSADKAIFFNCQMDGYQDTLYAHTYRQFYRDCTISGTIDFIFGDSAAVFQGCTLVVRKPADNQQCIVTAQGRKEIRQPTALVLQNCTFKADPELYPARTKVKTYLGRPWKEFSRTIIMESFLDDLIQPEGWLPWDKTFALDTLFYTEFNNRGPAAPKSQRVKWGGIKELPSDRVQRFTAAEFLDGNKWIQPTQLPYAPGFIFPVPKEDPNIKYSPVVPEENKDLGSKAEKSSNGDSSNDSSGNKKKDDSKEDDSTKGDSKKDDSKKDDSKSPPPPPPPSPPPPPYTDSPPLIPQLDKTAPALIITAAPEPSPSDIPTSDLGTSPPVLDVSPATSPSQHDSALASNPQLAPRLQPSELGPPNSISPSPISVPNIPEVGASISPSMAPSGDSGILSPDQSDVVTSPPASLPSSTNEIPVSSPEADVQVLNPAASPPMFNEVASTAPPTPNEAASAFSPMSNEVASPLTSAEVPSASPPTSNEAASVSPSTSFEVIASQPTSSGVASASPPTSSGVAFASPPTLSGVASASPPVSVEASASPPTPNGFASAPPMSNEGFASPPLSNEASASPPTSNEAASSPPMSSEVGSAPTPLSNEASSSPPTPNEVASVSPLESIGAAFASSPTSNEVASVSPLEAIEAAFASPPASNKADSASPPSSNENASASPPVSNEVSSASPPLSVANEGASASPPTSPSGSSPANSSQSNIKESKDVAASPPLPSSDSNIEQANEATVASPPISTTNSSGSTPQSDASASPPPSSIGLSVSTPQSDVASPPPNNPSVNAELTPTSDTATTPLSSDLNVHIPSLN